MESVCEHCVSGFLTTGEPKGKIEKLGTIDTYITRPEGKPNSAIIISSDVFGIYSNLQHIADQFAKETGFLCAIPDLFDGKACAVELMDEMNKITDLEEKDKWIVKNIFPWVKTVGTSDTKATIIEDVIKVLKEKEGIEKFGVQGYCYGAKAAVMLSQTAKVNCFAVAHPSTLKVPQDFDLISTPGLFLCADMDKQFPEPSRKQAEEILKNRGIKASFHFYPGTVHGFAVRGNEHDERVVAAKKSAFEEAVKIF